MADQFITDASKFSKDTQAALNANAKSQGITVEEYLKSRGGVNPVTKKYGDSYNPNIDLNDAEYLAAVGGAGPKIGDAGAALNAAREKKLQAYIAANPESPEAMRYSMESRAEARSNPTKTVSSVVKQSDGTSIVTYSDGSKTTLPAGSVVPTVGSSATTTTTSNTSEAATKAAEDKAKRQSAYDLLYSEFDQYGLGSLVTPLKDLITSGASPSEFTIRLRETDAYKKRFAANEARIKNGLRALSEAEYIRNEDNYQEVMRRRGLPPEYYAKGDLGVQKGFESLLAGDVSATELEDRIVTAQDRVLNANPEVAQALKAFYPGISNGDILAYSLDPANAINAIKRKITTAEIGGAAARSGLTTNVEDAAYLERYGVTKSQAEQGYGVIAGGLERGSQLASMYQQNPYTQATAETEIFKVPGAQEARKQRQKITGLEQATFSGKTGVSSSALARDRAGGY
jgi:hypothetical protein